MPAIFPGSWNELCVLLSEIKRIVEMLLPWQQHWQSTLHPTWFFNVDANVLNAMKPVPIIPCPIEHRRGRFQLYWSEGRDGDMVAHIRFNKELNDPIVAHDEPANQDAIRAPRRGPGDNGTPDGIPMFTDERSAALTFKIASESATQDRAPIFAAIREH